MNSHALPLVLSDVSSMICLEIRIVKSSIFGMPALVQTRGNQDSCATSKGVRLMTLPRHKKLFDLEPVKVGLKLEVTWD
ncbi:hypothetical protein ZWY2020_043648 [Hordeum vulgare]|nr:hypothetical protein ZWY2020_043648 [Hordeum vulgare]